MDVIEVTVDEVCKKLKGLSAGKSSVPDGINPRFLKEIAKTIALPMTILIRKSLSSQKLPMDWKTADISPILKNGNKSEAGNY